MHKIIPAIVWLIIMYTATALTAGIDAAPEGGRELVLFEARHIIIHALGYAVQIWLIAFALGSLSQYDLRCVTLVLMGLALAVGIGQETIQSVIRAEIYVLASIFDLAVDAAGAGMGLWVYNRLQNRRKVLSHHSIKKKVAQYPDS